MDRNYGSRRLMAPEEFVRGARIDQATNVYTLGRYAINALSRRTDGAWRATFQGPPALAAVLERATRPERAERYQRVGEFVRAFEQAAHDGVTSTAARTALRGDSRSSQGDEGTGRVSSTTARGGDGGCS
jgi:hypothetical protein